MQGNLGASVPLWNGGNGARLMPSAATMFSMVVLVSSP